MTPVVIHTPIITDKAHRVSGSNMLGMISNKILDTIPQRRNCLRVLVQTQDEAILFVALLHDTKRIKRNITKQTDTRLDAPIVLVVLHQRMPIKEASLEPTHESIALRVAVDDLSRAHVLSNLLGLALVDPIRVGPVLLGDEAVKRPARGHVGGVFLEVVVKRFLIEKDPVVMVFVVKAVLDLPHRLENVP